MIVFEFDPWFNCVLSLSDAAGSINERIKGLDEKIRCLDDELRYQCCKYFRLLCFNFNFMYARKYKDQLKKAKGTTADGIKRRAMDTLKRKVCQYEMNSSVPFILFYYLYRKCMNNKEIKWLDKLLM